MSFAEDFSLPFTRTVTVKKVNADGPPAYERKNYTVELLTTDDLMPWIAELTEKAKSEALALIPPKMKPQDEFNAKVSISKIECTPDSLRAPIAAGYGAIRILNLAAAKIGITDPVELASFVGGAGAYQNQKDAFRASAILSEEEFSDMFIPKPKGVTVPNDQPPSDPGE